MLVHMSHLAPRWLQTASRTPGHGEEDQDQQRKEEQAEQRQEREAARREELTAEQKRES